MLQQSGSRLRRAPQSCSQRAGGETCSPERANHLYPICLFDVQTENRPKLKRPPHLGGGRTSARLSRVCAARCSASRYATILYSLPSPMSIVDSRSHWPSKTDRRKAQPYTLQDAEKHQTSEINRRGNGCPWASPSGTLSIPDQIGAHDQRSKQRVRDREGRTQPRHASSLGPPKLETHGQQRLIHLSS